MTYLRKLMGIAVITAFVFPLFALGDAVLAQNKKEKIVVSHPPGFVIGILDFLKAMRPHLDAQGLELSLVPVRGGADNATTAASGRADVAMSSISPVVNVALQGGPIKIINIYGFEDAEHRTGTVIAVRSEIKDWKGLRGKILGTHRLGSLSEITARILLKAHGLEPGKDIDIIELPFGGMAPSLKRNQVQALAFFPPYVASVYNEGYGYELGKTSDVIPTFAREGWIANTSFLEKRPDAALRLMKAILLTTYDLSRMSNEQYIELITDLWKGDTSILPDLAKYNMLRDLFIYDPAAVKDAVGTHVNIMRDFKIVKSLPDGFLDSLVDVSVMKRAYDELRSAKRLP